MVFGDFETSCDQLNIIDFNTIFESLAFVDLSLAAYEENLHRPNRDAGDGCSGIGRQRTHKAHPLFT